MGRTGRSWRWMRGGCALLLGATAALLPWTDGLAQAPATEAATVVDAGPGAPGRILRGIASGPHRVVAARDRWALLRPEDASDVPVIVVQGSARVDTRVRGDLIVVDGDLRLGRGAVIEGRAIAIGGHVYPTAFAIVRDTILEYPADRFAATRDGGTWRLAWGPMTSLEPPPAVRLPGFAGFNVDAYSRVDALALRWGPVLTVPRTGITVEPMATWRTGRGVVDPSVALRVPFSRRAWIASWTGRTTASAEDWIVSDFRAAALGFLSGYDLRNWYRADRATADLHLLQDEWPVSVEVWGGMLGESVRPAEVLSAGPSAPWTIGHGSRAGGFLRPNPIVPPSRMTTARAGVRLAIEEGPIAGNSISVMGEVPVSPWDTIPDFKLIMAEARLRLPLWFGQRIEGWGHAQTSNGTVPLQRTTSLGGLGTLLTVPLLGMSGDHVAFTALEYVAPLTGTGRGPTLAARWATGAAGFGRFGSPVTNVGARFDLGPLRVEWAYDPAARRHATALLTTLTP